MLKIVALNTLNSLSTYLEKQTEAHPLVIPIQLLLLVFGRGAYTRITSYPRIGGGFHKRKSRMDPTVSVEDVFRNVLGVNAIYRVADVLSGCHNQTEGYEDEDG